MMRFENNAQWISLKPDRTRRIMRVCTAAAILVSLLPASAAARDITVATWNLGWHVDKATAATWVAKCDGLFEKDPTTGVWRPSTGGTGIPGWQVNFREKVEWDWTKFPVCDVYKDRSFDTVPVTVGAYDKRLQQLNDFIQNTIPADIYAFEEVSGEQAVREALPDGGNGYNVCTFPDFKVQRLAVAWKAELGEPVACIVEPQLSLPDNPEEDQPRPGLSVDLKIDGELLRILVVHLKSSCVSPLEASGDLTDGNDRDCRILQQQIVPIERWVEDRFSGADKVILLGDFNRNFWHEVHETGPVRTDGSSPHTPLPAGVLVKDLFGEVFDDDPASTTATLLPEECPINATTMALCHKDETEILSSDERKQLSQSANLGCRNPLGLDHILISRGIASAHAAEHVAIGVFGGTRPASDTHPDPLLAISDHCPMVTRLSL
ncbi:endonuclease/exonuclease/phosphatase family protein [Mesorhizobium sp. LSHC414A00]|uniref:endonuclease/exonuclease/phosphatase family protein n=1 Tax=Mesorhizobium sp. LSHC414A00 TaxID=1287287 RepID=UPI0018DBEDA5|nr:endonuclease/exonuclease/phosphatase family protein [Mesorhizobium sp. LSHC414A00]